jgi:hypothetical protein|tara:strand:+ start:1833 stop:2954 length:1122 start_codon:yes stop_codon:yes gene_type:complete
VAKRKPVRKRTLTVDLGNGWKGTLNIVPFSTMYESWENAAKNTTLPDKSGADNIYQFIENMGTVGRKTVNRKGESKTVASKSGPQKYISMALEADKKETISDEEANAVKELKDYLEGENNSNSKINPANIPFRTISGFDDGEDGEGRVTSYTTVYGDYRTKKYVQYRNKYKGDNLDEAKTKWYSFKKDGKAKPPVWQALFGKKTENDFFKHESLLEIAQNYKQELDSEPFNTNPQFPLRVQGNGTAKMLMDNVPKFREWVERSVDNTARYKSKSGNYRNERAMNDLLKVPISLTEAEGDRLLRLMKVRVNVNLEKLYVRVPKRQMLYAATLASNYDENYKKVEKSIVSRKTIRKSQEKSPVSLSWKEIIKVRR